jgi:hypothetical protein
LGGVEGGRLTSVSSSGQIHRRTLGICSFAVNAGGLYHLRHETHAGSYVGLGHRMPFSDSTHPTGFARRMLHTVANFTDFIGDAGETTTGPFDGFKWRDCQKDVSIKHGNEGILRGEERVPLFTLPAMP